MAIIGVPIYLTVQNSVVKIIDLDWCGTEGSARYPMDKNTIASHEWHDEATRGSLIKRDHDLFLFGRRYAVVDEIASALEASTLEEKESLGHA